LPAAKNLIGYDASKVHSWRRHLKWESDDSVGHPRFKGVSTITPIYIRYANQGLTSSQRSKSYYPVVKEITSGQLSFKDSGKALSKKILLIYKDLNTSEYLS
jgi:hypothetical protein